MTTGWAVAASMALVASGCAMKKTKVAIGQAPPAVRDTIQRELVGAELEDIARKRVDGQTVYETDVIRDGHKWEVVIREDGTILSKLQEEAVEPDAGSEPGHSGPAWRDRFDVAKADLLPTGTNTYRKHSRKDACDGHWPCLRALRHQVCALPHSGLRRVP